MRVSAQTFDEFERFLEHHSLDRDGAVEAALRSWMGVMESLPPEAIIPTRIVLSNREFDEIADLIEKPPKPTAAMRQLMRGAADKLKVREGS